MYFTFLSSKGGGRAFCTWKYVSQAHILSDISRHVAIQYQKFEQNLHTKWK